MLLILELAAGDEQMEKFMRAHKTFISHPRPTDGAQIVEVEDFWKQDI